MMHLTITRSFILSLIVSLVCAQNAEVDQQTNIRRRLERDDIQNMIQQQVDALHHKINMDIETDEEIHRLLKVEQSIPVSGTC